MEIEDLTSILVEIKSTGKDPLQEIDNRINSCTNLIQQLKDVRKLLDKSGKSQPMSQANRPHGQEKQSMVQNKLKIARYLMENETILKSTAKMVAGVSEATVHNYLNSDWFTKVRPSTYQLSEKGKQMIAENLLPTQSLQNTES